MTISWAVHRLNGTSSPANAMYSAEELKYHLETSKCKALFTVEPLLPVALEASKSAGLPLDKIFICETPGFTNKSAGFKTLGELVAQAGELPLLEPLSWSKGQGERQTAFLCYSSGTSGLPVSIISHSSPPELFSLLTHSRKPS